MIFRENAFFRPYRPISVYYIRSRTMFGQQLGNTYWLTFDAKLSEIAKFMDFTIFTSLYYRYISVIVTEK